jgi:hypothetical protein
MAWDHYNARRTGYQVGAPVLAANGLYCAEMVWCQGHQVTARLLSAGIFATPQSACLGAHRAIQHWYRTSQMPDLTVWF